MPVCECDSSCQVVLDPLPSDLLRSLTKGGKVRLGPADEVAVVEVMQGLLTGVEERVGGALSRSNRELHSRDEIDPEKSRDRSSSRRKRSGEKKRKSRRRSTSSSSTCSDASRKRRKKHKRHHRDEETEDVGPSPRVNPIFLWVKQDDTRIVEVLCEDYDKRNRIRLTKTPQGWRAIPRTERLCSVPAPSLVKSDIPLLPGEEKLESSEKFETKEQEAIPNDINDVENEDRLHSVNNDCDMKNDVPESMDIDKCVEDNGPRHDERCHDVVEEDSEPDQETGITETIESVPEPNSVPTQEELEGESEQEEEEEHSSHSVLAEHYSVLNGIKSPRTVETTSDVKDNDSEDAEPVQLNGTLKPSLESEPVIDPFDVYTFVDTPKTDVCEDDTDINCIVQAEVDSGVDSVEKSSVDGPEPECCVDSVDIEQEEVENRNEDNCLENEGREETIQMEEETRDAAADVEGEMDDKEIGKEENYEVHKEGEENDFEKLLEDEIERVDEREDEVRDKEIPEVNYEDDIEEEEVEDDEEEGEEEEEEEEEEMEEEEEIDEAPINLVLAEKKQPKDDSLSSLSIPYQNNVKSDISIESSPAKLYKLPEGTTIQQTEAAARPAHQKDKTKFLQAMLSTCTKRPSPSVVPADQEAPLDLGVPKKQPPPSCEPQTKKMKVEDITLKTILNRTKEKQLAPEPLEPSKIQQQNKNNSRLLELLTEPENSADPLAQLKEVLSDPDLQVPDPLLVPRARLPALVASPAREIPRLLSQKSETLTYPKLLTDPDLLPVSLSHLQMLLQSTYKEDELLKYQILQQQLKQEQAACGLDAATLNQMLWLPYLSQLEAAALACGNSQDFLAMLNLVFPPSPHANPYNLMSPLSPQTAAQTGTVYDYKSQMDFNQTLALWQETMLHANQMSNLSNSATQMKNINNNNNLTANNNLTTMKPPQNYQETKFAPRSQQQQQQQQQQIHQHLQQHNNANTKMTSARTSPISQSYQQQRHHRNDNRNSGINQVMTSTANSYNYQQSRLSSHQYTTAGYQQQNQRLSSVPTTNSYNTERNQSYNLQRPSVPVSAHSTSYYVPSSRIHHQQQQQQQAQNLHHQNHYHQTAIPKTTADHHHHQHHSSQMHQQSQQHHNLHHHHLQQNQALERLKSPPMLSNNKLKNQDTLSTSHHHHHHHNLNSITTTANTNTITSTTGTQHINNHPPSLQKHPQSQTTNHQHQLPPEVPKLKVKQHQHLIDPNGRPKLLKFGDQTDLTAHPHSAEHPHLWHPLFSRLNK